MCQKYCSSLKIFQHVPHSYDNKIDFGALLELHIIPVKECKWENGELWVDVLKPCKFWTMGTANRKEYILKDILTLESTGFDHWMVCGSVSVVSGKVAREDALQKDYHSLCRRQTQRWWGK